MVDLGNPITIKKSFTFTGVREKALVTENDTDQYIEVEGYASRMYHQDSNNLVIDSDNENINTFGIDLIRLKNGTMPVLFNHDQTKPVGRVMEAKYDKDGLFIKAKIFKYRDDQLTNFVYNSVKSGVISAFSVGIIVKSFDVVTQDGEEYLQLSESEMLEVSLVSVPANSHALFRMTNLKSVSGEDKVVTLLAKSALKSENQEACDGFSCAYRAQKEIQMSINDTTVKEAEAEEQKEAVMGVTQEALEQLEEILTPEPEDDTPSVQDTGETEGTVVVSGEADKIVDPNDRPSEEPQQDLEPETQPEPTVLDKVSALEGLDVDNLSDDELEAVYETLSNIVDKIESRVVNEIVQELTTVTAPAV